MSRRRDLAVMAVVLLMLQAPAVAALTGPSHTASSGVTYETNSGLEVELGDEREVEASPFADDETFASDGVEVQSPGPSAVRLNNAAWDGTSMAVRDIDAAQNPITLRRDDLSNDVTVEGGATDVIVHDIALDDGATDLEVVADAQTNITVEGLPDVDNVQLVDASGSVVASSTGQAGAFTLDAGTYELRIQDAPDELEIRDLTTGELVTEDANGDPLNVTVDFFGDEDAVDTRTTSDGTIDMSGLPSDERFAVTVETNGTYVTRQAIIPSVLEQDTVWLLPNSADIETVEPRFVIEDPSNQFDTEESEIVLERPVEINGTTEYVAVAGDRVGINGFDPLLEKDQRYRITVTDPESGSTRRLGEFTPTASELVTLTVQDVEFNSESNVDGLDWTARYITNENDANQIEFIYRDSLGTETVDYRIYERGNESNVLVDASGTGNVTVTETVPPSESETVWVVSFDATRDSGETISGSRQVSSDSLPVGPNLDPKWETIFAMIGLFAVAGLFGAANPGIGGIAVSVTGGMFWFIGWLPDTTGGLMVLLALFISVLAYVGRRARGATA